MKKTLMTAAAIAMLVGAGCGDAGHMSDARPMTDAEIMERKASMSKDFAAIETLIK